MIELWREHRAERRAQRAYLDAIARTDVSPLDMRDWTPDRLDRLAALVLDDVSDDRAEEIAEAVWIADQQRRLRERRGL